MKAYLEGDEKVTTTKLRKGFSKGKEAWEFERFGGVDSVPEAQDLDEGDDAAEIGGDEAGSEVEAAWKAGDLAFALEEEKGYAVQVEHVIGSDIAQCAWKPLSSDDEAPWEDDLMEVPFDALYATREELEAILEEMYKED